MPNINKIKINPGIFLSKEDFNFRVIWKDPTARSLLISNLIVLIVAVVQGWNFMDLLWVYFSQNLIIGFFIYLKILLFGNSLKLKETIKIESAGRERKLLVSMPVIGFLAASFFAFHYGFFHLIYFVFLMSFDKFAINWWSVLISGAIFFANHLFSFIFNFQKDKNNILVKAVGVKNLMFSAYRRIIPMHLMIIFGGAFFQLGVFPIPILILFVLLKTVTDIKMHQKEHAVNLSAPVASKTTENMIEKINS